MNITLFFLSLSLTFSQVAFAEETASEIVNSYISSPNENEALLLQIGDKAISPLIIQFKSHSELVGPVLKKILNPAPSLRRVDECGIESYNKQRDANFCGGYEFLEQRSVYCGVEQYRLITSMSCPGSRSESKTRCSRSPKGDFETRECTTPVTNFPATCRLESPDNVEMYRSCVNEHHPKIPKMCEHPSFGIQTRKECDIKMTRGEISSYFSDLTNNLETRAEVMLSYQSRLINLLGTPKALACFIRQFEKDSNGNEGAQKILEALQLQFITITNYVYEDFLDTNCEEDQKVDFSSISCSSDNKTPLCLYKAKYDKSLKYIEDQRKQLALILIDKVISDSHDEKLINQIADLDSVIGSYLK